MKLKLVSIFIFCIFQEYCFFCADEQEEYNIRNRMYKAIVFDQDASKVEQYLQEGFVLTSFYNRDKIEVDLGRNLATMKLVNRYFSYPQQGGNLIQVLLTHERSYFHDNKKSDYFKIYQLFLNYGGSIDTVDVNGNSMMHRIAKNPINQESKETFILLLRHHADMNLRNNLGDTPMHYAVSSEKPCSFVYSMTSVGGDLSVLDARGKTPLDYASKETRNKLKYYPIMLKKTCSPDSK